MKVVLLALSSRYIHLSPAPYYLAAALDGYDVTVLDHSVNEPMEAVLADILSSKPELLGLSAYIWNITTLKALVPAVKKASPETHIVLGGPEVSYNVRETLSSFPYALVLSGEGEEPFRLLCDALREEAPIDGIPACSFVKKDGTLHLGEPYVGTGTPKSPLKAGYAEALHGRIAYIEASRGCPFSCAFCLSGRCGGVRYFDSDAVKSDILALSRASRTVKFIDRTFNADRTRTKDLLSFILSHYGKEIPNGTRFHFEIAGELLDDEIFTLLKKAPHGAFQMEIGVQSLCPETLKAIRRSPRTERLCENVRRLIRLGNVHVHIDLIAGLPHEGLPSFRESFDGAYALSPHMLQLGFLKLLHGAPMREEPERYPVSFTKEPPYEVTETPALSKADLALIHTAEKALDRLYNSHRYPRTLALWQGSPFALFCALGEALKAQKDKTLDGEITLVYRFFAAHGIDESTLRDAMLLDFISQNSSRLTPTVLRREDVRLKKVKSALKLQYPEQKGIRRAVALLSQDRVAFTDYTEKDPLGKGYPTRVLSLDALQEKTTDPQKNVADGTESR